MSWSTIGKIIWTFILFPIIWILEHVVAAVAIVFAPLLHSLQYALHAALIPFRFLAKFETLYIFFGTAVLLGLLTGVILFLTAYLIGPILGVGRQTEESPRTAASYRAERAEVQARKAKERAVRGLGIPMPAGKSLKVEDGDWNLHQSHGAPTPMMGSMILEEDSSSD